jgi:hypothetical protein
METIQERRRLNDEIERTFISVVIYARNIMTFKQVDRGTSSLILYEGFYSDFSLLVMLTEDLQQLEKETEQEAVKAAKRWLSSSAIGNMNDRDLLARCNSGVEAFLKYKSVLSKQGVIALPSR